MNTQNFADVKSVYDFHSSLFEKDEYLSEDFSDCSGLSDFAYELISAEELLTRANSISLSKYSI